MNTINSDINVNNTNHNPSSLPSINELSIEEKVGQMFVIDFTGFKLNEEILEHINKIPWGGYILFAKNIRDKEELVKLNRDLMKTNPRIPPLISLDQEGGIVNRVDFPDMHLSPGNMALGRTGDPDLVETMAQISGIELRKLGFHLNFAPVADVNINPENPIIGVRSFGDDPLLVGKMVSSAVRGYQKAGMGACAKHFPGHGDTSTDSHLSLPVVSADVERLKRVELYPFQKAIEEKVASIMTAHVVFPAITGDNQTPATLSHKVLTELLQQNMGFSGLVITDSMSMKAIADHFGLENSALTAVNAGSHIILMCGSFENQIRAYNAVITGVKEGVILEEIIDKAVEKILEFKSNFILNPPPMPDINEEEIEKFMDKIYKKGVDILHQSPFKVEKGNALIVSPQSLPRSPLGEVIVRSSVYPYIKDLFPSMERLEYDINDPIPLFNEIEGRDSLGSYSTIILELFSRGKMKDEIKQKIEEFIRDAKTSTQGKTTVIMVSLLSPYNLPQGADLILTGYNYSPGTMKAVGEKLREYPG